MAIITATEFAKNIKKMTAIEAMADLYRTLPPEAGKDWVEDGRMANKLSEKIIETVFKP